METTISASILTADFTGLGRLVQELERSGADSLHLDVMDGHFVRNITFGPQMVKSIGTCTRLPLKVHLMIERPDLYVERFADAGSEILIIHRESPCNTSATIKRIRSNGMKAGLALNPETDLSGAIEFLPSVDMLLIMSVNPGFGGQRFLQKSLEKIRSAREYIDGNGLKTMIGVDGGINRITARSARRAGADELIAGAYIIGSENFAEAILQLRA